LSVSNTFSLTLSDRAVDVFIDELDFSALGFERVQPAATGRPASYPSTLLKIYPYGYLNRIQSSRRPERESARNIELMWLTGRLAPDCSPLGLTGQIELIA
jgi:transposase